jgi:hypothetical protein
VTIDTTKLRPYKNGSLPTIEGGLNTFLSKELQAISAASVQEVASLKVVAAAADALASGTVTTIAGNPGAFTLNGTSGITNTANDIKLSQASASQFGAVKVDNSTITASGGVITAVRPPASQITASLGGDVAMGAINNVADGPSIAQGTTGTWWVSGSVTVLDTVGVSEIDCKLWDGTTVISSGSAEVSNQAASQPQTVHLSGFITSPAGNLRISCKNISRATGVIKFNLTGTSKDSTISAFRIA